MIRKRQRLIWLLLIACSLAVALALSLNAMKTALVFFLSPSDVAANHTMPGQVFRLGGLVETGSFTHEGTVAHFIVTDLKARLPVIYVGVLPDLFREGQGVVAEGALASDGVFHATTVLAKHDENYMPPEVEKALGPTGVQHHQTNTLVK